MEEGGHYYTVYYASLAAGFNNATAKKQAVLAQMPDEVGWLDASNMHKRQCVGSNETDLAGTSRPVPSQWRYEVENGLHSLPEVTDTAETRSSSFQRSYTTGLLLRESPVSLKFGLLLHRLGDSYAHSIMRNESYMYTVTRTDKCFSDPTLSNFGHLRHMHDPDYAFLRTDLFYSYLGNLFVVLLRKANEKESSPYLNRNKNFRPLSFSALRNEFNNIFDRLAYRAKIADDQAVRDTMNTYSYSEYGAGSIPALTSKETKSMWLIEEIRKSSIRVLHTDMGSYHPETEDAMSLREFLTRRSGDLNGLRINNATIEKAVKSMVGPDW